MRVRRVIVPSVASPALQYYSTVFDKCHDFRGGGELLNTKRAFRLSPRLLSETSLTLRRNERDAIIQLQGGSNMTGTDLYKRTHKSVPVIFEPPCT